MKTIGFHEKRILITVKAYPVASISYGETVCCAGIDIDDRSWIRLYPVPFRDLEPDKQFNKYDIIQAKCAKATDDHRPESCRIQAASIEIIGHLGTKDNWAERKNYVLAAPISSFCEILGNQNESAPSFGLIKPKDVKFVIEKRRAANSEKRKKAYSKPTLFDKPKEMIEEVPFQFFYSFYCSNFPTCPGHRLSITDWEINQAYRKWRYQYSDPAILLRNIEKKWLEIIDQRKKDAFFFVGNLHRFRDEFVILGIFSPPISTPQSS